MTIAEAPAETPAERVSIFRQVLRAFARKAQNNAGVMIALYPAPDVAAELALPGGVPPEDLHLTLRILADDAADVSPRKLEQWAADVERAANDYAVLVGNVSGVGRFNGDQAGGADVIYATLDIPGLVDLYQRVRWIGCETGDDYDAERDRHDFTPHVTLAYGQVEVPDVATTPVRIDRLTLTIGGERREYLFAGADTAPADRPMPTPAPRLAFAYAEWSAAFVNDLPDSSFAIVLPGGEKDDEGKTTPRSLRKLPFKDAAGKVDAPHLRNALARLSSTDLSDDQRSTVEGRLKAAAGAVLAKALEERSEVVVTKAAEVLNPDAEVEAEVEPLGILRSGIEWMVRAGDESLRLIDDGTDVLTLPESMERMTRAWGGEVAKAYADGLRAIAAVEPLEDRYAVIKSEPERRYTLGVAYPATDIMKSAGPDAHGDTMTADELERAAWGFLSKGASPSGIMHKDGTGGAGKVVESYIYRGPTWKVEDETVEPGDWLLGVVWEEPAWADIQAGKLTGYSMQGFATRHGE